MPLLNKHSPHTADVILYSNIARRCCSKYMLIGSVNENQNVVSKMNNYYKYVFYYEKCTGPTTSVSANRSNSRVVPPPPARSNQNSGIIITVIGYENLIGINVLILSTMAQCSCPVSSVHLVLALRCWPSSLIRHTTRDIIFRNLNFAISVMIRYT